MGTMFELAPEVRGITHYKKRAFLVALMSCGSVTKAAKRAKVSKQAHYNWLAQDPAYSDAFRVAKDQALDALEDMLHDAAHEERNIVAAFFLLKGGRPEKYRDNVHLSGSLEIGAAEAAREIRATRAKLLALPLALPEPTNGHAS
jgi:hypothetical protein